MPRLNRICRMCNKPFSISEKEQEWLTKHGLDFYTHCGECRRKRRINGENRIISVDILPRPEPITAYIIMKPDDDEETPTISDPQVFENTIHKWFEIYVFFVVALVCVGFIWQGLELLMYGMIQPRSVDNIIGSMLAASLTGNFFALKRRKKEKNNEINY